MKLHLIEVEERAEPEPIVGAVEVPETITLSVPVAVPLVAVKITVDCSVMPEIVRLPVQIPSSVNCEAANEVVSSKPAETDKVVFPETLLVVLLAASLAVMVAEKAVPLLAVAGAATVKVLSKRQLVLFPESVEVEAETKLP